MWTLETLFVCLCVCHAYTVYDIYISVTMSWIEMDLGGKCWKSNWLYQNYIKIILVMTSVMIFFFIAKEQNSAAKENYNHVVPRLWHKQHQSFKSCTVFFKQLRVILIHVARIKVVWAPRSYHSDGRSQDVFQTTTGPW